MAKIVPVPSNTLAIELLGKMNLTSMNDVLYTFVKADNKERERKKAVSLSRFLAKFRSTVIKNEQIRKLCPSHAEQYIRIINE